MIRFPEGYDSGLNIPDFNIDDMQLGQSVVEDILREWKETSFKKSKLSPPPEDKIIGVTKTPSPEAAKPIEITPHLKKKPNPSDAKNNSISFADASIAFLAASVMGSKDKMGYVDAMVGSRGAMISFEKKLVDDLTHGIRPGQAPFQARGVRVGMGYGSIKYEWGTNGFKRFDLQGGVRSLSVGAAFSKGEGVKRVSPYMRVTTGVDQRVKAYIGLDPETKKPRIDHLSNKRSTLARTVAGTGVANEVRLPAPKGKEIGKIIGKGATSIGVDFLFYAGAGALLDLVGLDSNFNGRGAVQLMTGLVLRETTKAVISKVKDGRLPDNWGKQTLCSVSEGAIALYLHENYGRMLSDITGVARSDFNFGMHAANFALMWGSMALFSPALKQCRPADDEPPSPKPVLEEERNYSSMPEDPSAAPAQIEAPIENIAPTLAEQPNENTHQDVLEEWPSASDHNGGARVPLEPVVRPTYIPQIRVSLDTQQTERSAALRYIPMRRTLYTLPLFMKRH